MEKNINLAHVKNNSCFLNLKSLSDDKLIDDLKSLASQERKIQKQIILHIVEIDRRKLFLTKGFSSLFEYLTDFIGFSRGTAQRCIDAARLSYDVPEVIDHIEEGTIKLSQVSLLQQSFREVHAKTKSKVSALVKKNLVSELIDKSVIESQVVVKQRLDIDLKQTPKIQHQKDESVRLEVTLSKSQWQKLEKMRELLSNSVPDGTWDKVLEYVSDKVIQQKDKSRLIKSEQKKKPHAAAYDSHVDGEKTKNFQAHGIDGERTKKTSCYDHAASGQRTYLSKSTERIVFSRDQCCQFTAESTIKPTNEISPQSKSKICGSKWQLNIDHIQPVWAAGTNDLSNLRVLCGQHNRDLYRRQSNIRRN